MKKALTELAQLIHELQQTEHGFKHIVAAGDALLAHSGTDHLSVALSLLDHESYQARMLGTYLLGVLSPDHKDALKILHDRVSLDDNWRVQEMVAKAIDYYYKTVGHEAGLPVLEKWLSGKNPNTKRAVIEGLRIWTSRPYFKTHPEAAIALIAAHRGDESEYLRKSVGNALRDIRRKHAALVDAEIAGWNTGDKRIAFTKKRTDQ